MSDGSYKIKIKDSHPHGSISNVNFNIEKGDIVKVDKNFKFDPTVFEKVPDSPKEISVLTDDEIKKFLNIKENFKKETSSEVEIKDGKISVKHENPEPIPLTLFKQKVAEANLHYEELMQLLEAERNGLHRADFIDFLQQIPKAKDTGLIITENTQLMGELRSIKHSTDKAVHLIAKTFRNAKELTKALKDEHKLFKTEAYRNDFTPQFMQHLKKHYGLIKSIVTTKEVFRKGRGAMPHAAPVQSNAADVQNE